MGVDTAMYFMAIFYIDCLGLSRAHIVKAVKNINASIN